MEPVPEYFFEVVNFLSGPCLVIFFSLTERLVHLSRYSFC